MNERILLAEVNPALRGDLCHHFTGNNYTVESVASGTEALSRIDYFAPDLVILDTLLPGGGAELCKTIRTRSSVPIILTSPSASVAETVKGLESGADDFIEKPCDLRELTARAKAVMRRSKVGLEPNEKLLLYENFELSLEKYELKLRGKRVDLTPKELQLLYFLASNPNKVYTRDQLLDQVWGYNYLGNTRTIDAHIRKVREKCEGVSSRWAIRTIWGVGYKFETA
ncbi:MAG: response regulator transcription factor [Clostridia bacterium]|nr:response regulator transcription factor [Clostridia bacterium]